MLNHISFTTLYAICWVYLIFSLLCEVKAMTAAVELHWKLYCLIDTPAWYTQLLVAEISSTRVVSHDLKVKSS